MLGQSLLLESRRYVKSQVQEMALLVGVISAPQFVTPELDRRLVIPIT